MNFKIITAIWNGAPFVDRYLTSIDAQTHPNMEVVIVDDNSDDGTTQKIFDWVQAHQGQPGHRWNAIFQQENRGALYNQVTGIRLLNCEPDDVLVFVDGDDQLAHPNVLQVLEEYYKKGMKLTYGQYEPVPPSPTCTLAAEYPPDIKRERNFRYASAHRRGIYWNHLRTFKYELFAQLTDDDFKDESGGWYKTATDAALMYPCIELAAPDFAFIPEVLYLYTSDNQLSDWRRWSRQCDHDHNHILARPPKR